MADLAHDNKFPKSARLRKRREFLSVQQDGRRSGSGRYFVLLTALHNEPSRQPPVRLGVTVSKKVGNAVTRNRVKRQVRACFRRTPMPPRVPAQDWVVIARPSAGKASGLDCRADLKKLFSRPLGARS